MVVSIRGTLALTSSIGFELLRRTSARTSSMTRAASSNRARRSAGLIAARGAMSEGELFAAFGARRFFTNNGIAQLGATEAVFRARPMGRTRTRREQARLIVSTRRVQQ
jgi:hypothetical protein